MNVFMEMKNYFVVILKLFLIVGTLLFYLQKLFQNSRCSTGGHDPVDPAATKT